MFFHFWVACSFYFASSLSSNIYSLWKANSIVHSVNKISFHWEGRKLCSVLKLLVLCKIWMSDCEATLLFPLWVNLWLREYHQIIYLNIHSFDSLEHYTIYKNSWEEMMVKINFKQKTRRQNGMKYLRLNLRVWNWQKYSKTLGDSRDWS